MLEWWFHERQGCLSFQIYPRIEKYGYAHDIERDWMSSPDIYVVVLGIDLAKPLRGLNKL